jgi:hypothetical protein
VVREIIVPTAITWVPRLYRWVAVMALGCGRGGHASRRRAHAHPGGLGNGAAGMTMLSPRAEARPKIINAQQAEITEMQTLLQQV